MVRALTGGRGADLVLDTVGGPLFEPCLKSLAAGGRQLVITSRGASRVEFDLVDFYHNRSSLIGVDTAKLHGEEIAQILDQLRDGFESGGLRAPEVVPWPISDAAAAYKAAGERKGGGRHVLVPA